jgi:hypothetical protein
MNKQKVIEKLKLGRALIADRNRWTQGAYARAYADVPGELKGFHCMARSDRAVCWCSVGAIKKVAPFEIDEAPLYKELLKTVTDNSTYESVEQFNDSSSHEAVLAMWDATIERLEA